MSSRGRHNRRSEPKAPAGAAWLLRRCLPADLAEVVAGDLDEELVTFIARSRSPLAARWWYWRHAVASIVSHHRPAVPPRQPVTGKDLPMSMLMQDVVYALRRLRKDWGFGLTAVLTLALGIGASSAIYSMAGAFVWKPLPYHEPARVAFTMGWDTERARNLFNVRLADYLDVKRQATTLEDAGAYHYWSANLTGLDVPERVQGYRVTTNMFSLLGVAPIAGRTFAEDEGRPGGPNVVMLSHGLWQRRFGGDPAIVGRRVTLNEDAYTVIGVMPRRFEFPVFNFKGDLWTPWRLDPQPPADRSAGQSAVVISRHRADVTLAGAQRELDTIAARLAADHPQTNRGFGFRLVPMGELGAEIARPAVAMMFGAVGAVLVLACINIASLMLARGLVRRREFAVRAALGAGRWRIARQVLVESLIVAVAGGFAGVLLAAGALAALRGSLPEFLQATTPNLHELRVDRGVVGFALALTVGVALLFGLGPAIGIARSDLNAPLKEGARSGGGARHQRLRKTLVVAEVALSLLLLALAGVLTRSFRHLSAIDPGFDPSGVLTMSVTLPEQRHPDDRALTRFFERAVDEVSGVPGVTVAGAVNALPFSTYDSGGRYLSEGQPEPDPGRAPRAAFRVVTERYFETLRIPLLRGRAFTRADRADAAPVVIVNEALAQSAFGGDAVGRRIRLGPAANPWRTIVGVVGAVRHTALTDEAEPQIYMPLAQGPARLMMLAIRTTMPPATLTPAVRRAIVQVDPLQPVFEVNTLQGLMDNSLMSQSMVLRMTVAFAAGALLLATIGLYGVVAYLVSQQRRELAVRVALGAAPREIAALVSRSALSLVALGVVIGVPAAMAAGRLMSKMLFGVSPYDAPTYVVVSALLAVAGLAASYLPARRAMRIDPIEALRSE